jgi:hypothetical protein
MPDLGAGQHLPGKAQRVRRIEEVGDRPADRHPLLMHRHQGVAHVQSRHHRQDHRRAACALLFHGDTCFRLAGASGDPGKQLGQGVARVLAHKLEAEGHQGGMVRCGQGRFDHQGQVGVRGARCPQVLDALRVPIQDERYPLPTETVFHEFGVFA